MEDNESMKDGQSFGIGSLTPFPESCLRRLKTAWREGDFEDSAETFLAMPRKWGVFSATAPRTDRKRSPGAILRGFRRTKPIWIAKAIKDLDDGRRLVGASKAFVFCIESRAHQPSPCQGKFRICAVIRS